MEWVEIFASTELHMMTIVRAVLLEHQIVSIIYNKRDSMYQMLNMAIPFRLLVAPDDVIKAKHVLHKHMSTCGNAH